MGPFTAGLNEWKPVRKRGTVIFTLQNMSGAASYDIAAVWHDLDVMKIQTITMSRQNGRIVCICYRTYFAG